MVVAEIHGSQINGGGAGGQSNGTLEKGHGVTHITDSALFNCLEFHIIQALN